MNTKLIMTASALLLATIGLLFTFLPAEILQYFNAAASKPFVLLIQISGALYFSFAMLNWMTRSGVFGGIYNKPIIVANLTHFLIGAPALVKAVLANPGLPPLLWAAAAVYALFAIYFGILFMKNPAAKTQRAGAKQ